MAERYLNISNYRNVGISKEQRLLLNTSIKKGEMGDLIIVVGPNNSGKSNCLDATLCLSKNHKITRNDIPDFYNEIKNPEISLLIKDEGFVVGTTKRLTSDGEQIESFYETQGEERKSKIVKSIEISDEAKHFAVELIANMPLKLKKPIKLTQDIRNFGVAILNTISNNWGSSYLNNIRPNLYNQLRNNVDAIFNDRKDIFEQAIQLISQNWGDNYRQYLPSPYNSYSKERLQKMLTPLLEEFKEEDIEVSNNTKKMIGQLIKQFQDQAKITVSTQYKNMAIKLINGIVEEDEKSAKRNSGTRLSSNELITTYNEYTSKNKLPLVNSDKLIKEAHEIALKIASSDYYIKFLNVNTKELKEFFDSFNKQNSLNLSDFSKTVDLKKYRKEVEELHKYGLKIWGDEYWNSKLHLEVNQNDVKRYIYELTTESEVVDAPEVGKWEKDNQLLLNPNIIRFRETEITKASLTETPSNVQKSDFFSVLFKAINYDLKHLNNLYEDIKSGNKVTANLRVTERDLNQRLEAISSQFNRLFFQSKEKYLFEIILETEKIEFSIYVGNLPLNLDKQSTGFKWFFNFYFTVIAQKGLKRGDIVIMDEPATNLHVSGIQELRSFIKDYAKRSELTFIISTHSPFFIDVDHLEEVRVVNRNNGEAIITDKFHVIQDDDTDALRPVKDALTVGRHILLDPTKKTIFVEGITDYCYLTAFKKMFNHANGLHFLPIQGLKKEDIIGKILRIDKNPTILVDSDHYGNGVKLMANDEKYKSFVEVIKLEEIDSSFTDMESLFHQDDRPEKKSFNDAVKYKNGFSQKKINDLTLQNFNKLFENISS